MLPRLVGHVGVVLAAIVTMVAVTAGPAHAGNTEEYVTVDGIGRGYIVHIDVDDHFHVEDIYADGYGVYGAVQENVNGNWVTRGSEEDGGDSGSDMFSFNVEEEDWDAYRLKICWRTWCEYDSFRE